MEQIIFDEATHRYTCNGKNLISVTQLLQKHGLSTDYSAVDMDVLKKAADKGTIVHKEIEEYLKTGEVGFTWECEMFAKWYEGKADEIEYILVEQIVHNDTVAGKFDLFIKFKNGKKVLYDIKTTYSKHVPEWSWQLSLYNRLGQLEADELMSLWLRDNALKEVELNMIEESTVDRLLKAEKEGYYFTQDSNLITSEALKKLTALETVIANLELQKAEAEMQVASMREQLLKAMEEKGIKTFETPLLKVTYKSSSTRTSLDSKKLKEEQAKIYEQYKKTSTVKSSITIKVKEN